MVSTNICRVHVRPIPYLWCIKFHIWTHWLNHREWVDFSNWSVRIFSAYILANTLTIVNEQSWSWSWSALSLNARIFKEFGTPWKSCFSSLQFLMQRQWFQYSLSPKISTSLLIPIWLDFPKNLDLWTSTSFYTGLNFDCTSKWCRINENHIFFLVGILTFCSKWGFSATYRSEKFISCLPDGMIVQCSHLCSVLSLVLLSLKVHLSTCITFKLQFFLRYNVSSHANYYCK